MFVREQVKRANCCGRKRPSPCITRKEEAPAAGMRNPRHRFLPKPTSMVELMGTIEEEMGKAPPV